MSVAGDASAWSDIFPDDLVPQVLILVLDAWQTYIGNSKPSITALEVTITREFRPFLIRSKTARSLPLRIEREVPEDDLATGAERGRIDLKFIPMTTPNEEVFLTFECKRLRVPKSGRVRSLAAEYVKEGMARFVRGQYGPSHRHAGMIGYVLDGKMAKATVGVANSVKKNRVMLSMNASDQLTSSSLLPAESAVRETRHARGNRLLLLHHVFLAC